VPPRTSQHGRKTSAYLIAQETRFRVQGLGFGLFVARNAFNLSSIAGGQVSTLAPGAEVENSNQAMPRPWDGAALRVLCETWFIRIPALHVDLGRTVSPTHPWMQICVSMRECLLAAKSYARRLLAALCTNTDIVSTISKRWAGPWCMCPPAKVRIQMG
jgi:hypothetical protein